VATPRPSVLSWSYQDPTWPEDNSNLHAIAMNKKKWHDFERSTVIERDVVEKGMITEHDAVELFNA